MKLYKCFILIVMLATAFVACERDEQDTTTVTLEAFGPSPALRGSSLTFIGKNLDKVVKIILPDNIEITDIERIDNEKIIITIPQNAEVGYVKLIYAGGKEIVSKTILNYTEPIVLTSWKPSPVKAGQTLTLEGDYLNLIERVIFADNVIVDSEDFTTWERGKIELVLPAEAQTGVIILADKATIPLELESDAALQVVLPAVSATQNLTGAKPDDVITVAGTDLDLVVEILLPDGTSVPFTYADGVITFTLPDGVTDGAIVMVPASGVHVAVANIGVAVPAELTATPNTGLKGGDVITITGINMELVTTVTFPNVAENVTPDSKTATQITVTMPAMARSGDLVLNTASGNTASVAIETAKPEALNYSENPIAAGADLTITGSNLDLIEKLTFGGNVTVNVSAASAASLSVTVPTTAETGSITATMFNGETVVFLSLTVNAPLVAYIPVMPNVEIKGGKLFIVSIANADKLTGVQLNGQTCNYVLDGDQLYIGIPSNAYGNCVLKLISSNGEIEYTINVVPGGSVATVIWDEGPLSITWSDGGRVMIPISAFSGVTAGTYLKFEFQQTENWGQAQINNGSWAVIPFAELGNDGYLKTDGPMIDNDKSITSVEVKLTQSVLDNINNNTDGTWGIIIQGSDWIFTKISLVVKAKVSEEIYTGPTSTGSWSGYAQIAADKFTNAVVGNIVHIATSKEM
jgi:hypothetical protein